MIQFKNILLGVTLRKNFGSGFPLYLLLRYRFTKGCRFNPSRKPTLFRLIQIIQDLKIENQQLSTFDF